jgi:hypothetical protein
MGTFICFDPIFGELKAVEPKMGQPDKVDFNCTFQNGKIQLCGHTSSFS